ncbi:hypothetical protein Droror1_Dr00025431 [Drosera rotundifolia]
MRVVRAWVRVMVVFGVSYFVVVHGCVLTMIVIDLMVLGSVLNTVYFLGIRGTLFDWHLMCITSLLLNITLMFELIDVGKLVERVLKKNVEYAAYTFELLMISTL